MMSHLWVRKTLALACLTLLAISFPSHADEPAVEMVRFRPFGLFGRGKSEERNEKERESAPSLQEPLAAPPSARLRSAPSSTSHNSDGQADPLLLLTERAIEKTSHRYLDANQHRPWQIIHGLLALRRDFVLRDGNRMVNAIDWISNGAQFRGTYWFEATEHGGRAHPYNGVPYEFEGHVNQTLALMALSNLPLNHEFKVARGRTVTMADMIHHAQMTVSTREEITWTLWFLTHYLDIDTEWVNAAGEPWSLEELVRLQTEAKVVGAPCGGTHGLFALAYARNSYLYKHGRLRGVWFQADQKVKQHIELARSLQNSDGSFSIEYFKGPGYSRDFNERIKSNGHMLEWLMMALPQSRLDESWVRRAVASVATDLVHHSSRPAECGPLYHALHSLVLYRDRVTARPATTESLAETSAPSGPSAPSASDTSGKSDQSGNPAPVAEPAESQPVATDPPEASQKNAVDGVAAAQADSGTATADTVQSPELPPVPVTREPIRLAIDPDDTRPIQ